MEAQIDSPERVSEVSLEERRMALERVLNSKYFAHAPMKQKFLRLICDFQLSGRGGELNEYLIGREVFDRDESYNPATDPIVRVGAHGVREKLALYYQKEGTNDQVRIEIPIGNYEPSFIHNAGHGGHSGHGLQTIEQPPPPLHPAQREAETTPLAPVAKPDRLWLYAIFFLALGSVAFLYSYQSLRRQNSMPAVEKHPGVYKVVWEPFLRSDRQTLVVLSNPPVFRFINKAESDQSMDRSIPVPPNQLDKLLKTLPNKQIIDIISNRRLLLTTETYTGIGEAMGVYRVTDLLSSRGKSLSLKQSRTVSAEDLKNHNVIVLGSTWVNNWSGKLPAREVFAYNKQVAIDNHDPRAGEERIYTPVFEEQTGNLTTDYALITVSPNISDENVVMVLAGAHSEGTAAAAEYVTGKHYLNEFNDQLIQIGGGSAPPKYYQALLKVGVENGFPTTISLVSVHELRKSKN
jgi:hypothetical protein